ncbi:hypothetical protein AALO_G00108670 [Alosa alosa]|uniref:Uncharacterized protein n=1 Tax=Alosa alosa TaxID=278164 RepID=A0AAV6GSN7_9TELE|nr:hypothetical protein AALO_G00108670 [Alosa alosa]
MVNMRIREKLDSHWHRHKEAVKVPYPAVPSYQNVPHLKEPMQAVLSQQNVPHLKEPMQANMSHSAVPSQQNVQHPKPKPQKPENKEQEQDESEKGVSIPQLELEKLVHTVVKEIWDMYDLGCICRTAVFKMAKPQPSEEFLRNLTCARNIKTAVRNNYCKHIFELCWGILLGLFPKPDDSGYAWYKPRPEDNIQSINSSVDFSKVKEYVTRKVFRLCGFPTEPKGAKHIQFHLEDELELYPRPKCGD